MISKSDPWYVHAALYTVIVILVVILVKVVIIDPNDFVQKENYYRTESRLRMKDIKEGEILFYKKHNKFSGNLDTLVDFIKTSPLVDSAMAAYDTLTKKSSNPFLDLSSGKFTPDSLIWAPKSHQRFTLEIDTSVSVDTVVNRYGRITKIDTTKKIGTKYYLEDPDGYGSIGSINNEALKNTASWEQ